MVDESDPQCALKAWIVISYGCFKWRDGKSVREKMATCHDI